MRRLAVFLAVTVLALAATPAQSAGARPGGVSYRPPVDGPVVDEFRLPDKDWQPGNRGIDYAPEPGAPVRSAADGEVVFAGQVGGSLHVVVLHADGVRTSYSFLQSIAVHRGAQVRQGQPVGTSGPSLHFGARVGETYIDPRSLFDDGPPHVFLVPDEVRQPGTEAEERSGLGRFLRKLFDAGRATLHFAAGEVLDRIEGRFDEVLGVIHYAWQFDSKIHTWRLVRTGFDWYRQRGDCTPASVEPPPLPEKRIAVLVAGLGSSSAPGDSVDDVDPAALGYDESLRFSYLGGSTEQNAYTARDTTIDLREQAKRLRQLLEQVHRDKPGVPVDIIAHSQGGIIARAALAEEYDPDETGRFPRVANLVTLGSPHKGTDIATALTMLSHTTIGDVMLQAVDGSETLPFELAGDSISQLSETSIFLFRLNRKALPEGVRLTSISARGDLTVPALHSRVKGGRNVTVSVDGILTDHSALPGSDEGRREVALAVAGLPPTCQSLGNMVADTVVSDVIATAQDAVGAAAYLAASRVDGKRKRE
ncbi:MAG: peptidoglycan DD-metalloendopeptidase family protein [Actinomycetota bacterium]